MREAFTPGSSSWQPRPGAAPRSALDLSPRLALPGNQPGTHRLLVQRRRHQDQSDRLLAQRQRDELLPGLAGLDRLVDQVEDWALEPVVLPRDLAGEDLAAVPERDQGEVVLINQLVGDVRRGERAAGRPGQLAQRRVVAVVAGALAL